MGSSRVPADGGGPPYSEAVVERILAFVERTTDLIGVADEAGNVVYANPATRARVGIAEGDARPVTTADLFPEAAFHTYHDEIRPAILRDGVWSGLVPVHAEDGATIEVWLTVVGGVNPGGEVSWTVTSGRDVTEWRRLGSELSWRATHDDLTGLARRVLLDDRLDLALARARRDGGLVAAVFVDVDDLKSINDSFGHRAGDDVLAEISRRMVSAVRSADTVARLGGDEFVVLFDGVDDEDEADTLAERVRDAVMGTPIMIPGSSMSVSVSFGRATATGDVSATELLGRADAAMYDTKRQRRMPVASRRAAGNRRSAEASRDLASAVSRRLVVPQYQPVVAVATGETVGYQALARWGALPAEEFIDLSEGSGVGLTLDLASLRQATADAARWTWPPLPRVYVHVGSRFLADPSMESFVREVLERAQLDPSRLAIEIPEQLLARGTSVFPQAVHRLHALGVRLVVSGVGFHAPPIMDLAGGVFDEMRLAVAIVDGVVQDLSRARAAAGMIALARALGLASLAVGVQDEAQRNRLAAMGCDLMEGVLVGEVVPASAIEPG